MVVPKLIPKLIHRLFHRVIHRCFHTRPIDPVARIQPKLIPNVRPKTPKKQNPSPRSEPDRAQPRKMRA